MLIVDKPSGLPTMGVQADRASLVNVARDYIKQKYAKPGNVYLGVVSRVDTLVSGAVVFARTSKAAARLTEIFRERDVRKTYLAAVEGQLAGESGEWSDWLWHDDAAHRIRVVAENSADAKLATLAWRLQRRLVGATVVTVDLHTGRKHQIRVQFASRGHAILGDAKYGARSHFSPGIALHSWKLAFEHPVRHVSIDVEAAPPASWRRLLTR